MGKGGNITVKQDTHDAQEGLIKKHVEIKASTSEAVPGHTDFYWSKEDEPHASRCKEILAAHPEIKKLFGYDPYMRYQVIAIVALQLTLAFFMRDKPWGQFLLVAYVIGGTCNHFLFLAVHELTHNLGFKNMIHNKLFAIFTTIPVALPLFSFKSYHMDHHRYHGVDGIDASNPTALEGKIFVNAFAKFLFVFFQLLFFGIRPILVNPKVRGKYECLNILVLFATNSVIYYFGGISAIGYLLLSDFLGFGLHPIAGHMYSDHYVHPQSKVSPEAKTKLIETYSNYSPLNMLTFNIGYHNEHHDFPFIPGSRLPQVRELAPEFYDDLPKHDSFCKVIWDFITNPNISLFSCVKRHTTSALTGNSDVSKKRK
jgi:sphingolipid delta-4 desaturase